MNTIPIAGLSVQSISKKDLLEKLGQRLAENQKTFLTTPYSEFLYHSLKDPQILQTLNQADFAVPDGIGLFWARTFLNLEFKATSYYGKIAEAFWQMVISGAAIIVYPKFVRDAFLEKIPGSELIWDLAKLAAEKNQSIYLLGGFGNTPKIVAEKLQSYVLTADGRKLSIAGHSSKNPGDDSLVADIQKANPGVLLVAFGPLKQEQWITEHMHELPAKLFVGLGGTFDYIAGKQTAPPAIVRSMGLEWLWRLFTQPKRIKRIFHAVPGLITALIRYKIFMSMPYRPNVVCVILNTKNEILICRRNPHGNAVRKFGHAKSYITDHWQMPQGGMDKKETFAQTAWRESYEEVGLKNLEVLKVSAKTSSYIWNNSQRKLFRNAHYKGQQQHIVYLKHYGPNDAVQIDNQEFVDYRWVKISDINSVVHPERLQIAKIAQEDLKDLC